MKKKTKSITFFISVFFILLNMVSFALIFYLVRDQYYKSARKNIENMSMAAAESMERNFDDVLSYMNDLTLKMYSDEELNGVCSEIYKENYEDEAARQNLIIQAEDQCYDYLYYYGFIQAINILLEDGERTDIQIRKTYNAKLYSISRQYREELQEKVIANQGVIRCYDVGDEHQIVYSRTLRDFKNVLKDDSVIGTVMVTLSPQYLLDALENMQVTPNSFALLKNSQGVVSYSVVDEYQNQEASLVKETLEIEKAQLISMDIDSLDQELWIVIPANDIILSTGDIINTLANYFLLIVVLNLLLVGVISFLLTKPMEHLVRQIQAIGVNGSKKRQIEASGYSEIQNIAENFNQMLRRIERLAEENYAIGLSEKNARIEALQSQINPHFIFNTLDTINWKVMFLDVPEVSNMVTCLGDMLRYTTYQYGKYVTVEQELSQIRNYLYIQEIRYDHSFETYIRVDESLYGKQLPCLIIQPLVENAVIHGLHGKKNGVLVIRIKEKNGTLEIMVFDNGKGMEEEIRKSILKENKDRESIGLANVDQRLRLLYTGNAGLHIYGRKGYYTKIEFTIPYTDGRTDAG